MHVCRQTLAQPIKRKKLEVYQICLPTDRLGDLIHLTDRPGRGDSHRLEDAGQWRQNQKCPCEVKIHIETKGKSKYLDQGRKEKSWLHGGCAFAS